MVTCGLRNSSLNLGEEWNILICGVPFSVTMQQLIFGPPCILIVKIAAGRFYICSLFIHHVCLIDMKAHCDRDWSFDKTLLWRNGGSGAVWGGSVCSGRCFAVTSQQHTAASHGSLLSHVSHARRIRTSGTGRPALSRLLPRPPPTAVGKYRVRPPILSSPWSVCMFKQCYTEHSECSDGLWDCVCLSK